MASTAFTDGVTLVPSSWLNDIDTGGYSALSAVAGTNTITATGPLSQTAYSTGQLFRLIPANTNTGATTINISNLGAKNVFWNGAACVGGELRQSIPCALVYDGTRFHIFGNGFNAPFLDSHPIAEGSADSTKKVRLEVDGLTTATTRVVTPPDRDINLGVTLGTEQASTSGTAINFTGIPSGVRRITIMFKGVSTNGTSNLLVQLGGSGGIENSGYLSRATDNTAGATSTAGFVLTGSGINAASILHGSIVLNLENSAAFSWTSSGNLISSVDAVWGVSAGSKSTSTELDRVRITTVNGTDAFDAGAINISYDF